MKTVHAENGSVTKKLYLVMYQRTPKPQLLYRSAERRHKQVLADIERFHGISHSLIHLDRTPEEGGASRNTQLTEDCATKRPVILTADDLPGLQVSLLKDELPQSVFDLDIKQLIGFIQRYQSTSTNPQQLSNILGLLQHYQASCPNLQYIQLIFPWYGALPYIDINIDSKIGWSAKVQFSSMLAVEVVQYIRGSWATAEVSDRGIA